MKLANWNVSRAREKSRRAALRTVTDSIAADVWVLTETRDSFHPGLPYSCSSAGWRDALPGLDEESDRWVSIWSRFPLERLDVRDTVRTVSARVHPPGEAPFLIFGTILPWADDKWRGYPCTDGAAFREALKVQQWDWRVLRKEFPTDEFFLMGQFHQDLSRALYHGSKMNKETLLARRREVRRYRDYQQPYGTSARKGATGKPSLLARLQVGLLDQAYLIEVG